MDNPITPHIEYPSLAKVLGISNPLYFKFENKHPLGSHKGRSIPLMIEEALESGQRDFAISSSGNAALASAIYTQSLISKYPDIRLTIFVGFHIADHKLSRLQSLRTNAPDNIVLSRSERPRQQANVSAQNGAVLLRQSTNETALLGYSSLADEISTIPNVSDVFVGTSSGTTAEGLLRAFAKKTETSKIRVHIVQTTACNPLARARGLNIDTSPSMADAIVDTIGLRASSLIPLMEKTDSQAYIATDEALHSALSLCQGNAVTISINSALSVVGLMEHVFQNREIGGSVVCLICGE